MMNNKARVIAFYLPQFHPIPENDEWWGKGFTEWTNVGKAKPLFKGHYQPRVPADLGYYDLRLPQTRQAQADMAKEYGIEGFCYWHYWFGNGKRLLERPFNEVLKSGQPDFPFCLAWANHSWEDKSFKKGGSNKLLIAQTYPGEEDYINHFYALLPAFQDKRYIRVDNKPLFLIYDPQSLPDVASFISLWNKLAKENHLEGIHFVAQIIKDSDADTYLKYGFDALTIFRSHHYFFAKNYSFIERMYIKMMRVVFHRGRIIPYKTLCKYLVGDEDAKEYIYPVIFPNLDRSPRSGRDMHIIIDSTPKLFARHVRKVLDTVNNKKTQHKIVFCRSWNEWAEGNYMEPDLKFGKGYLEALKRELDK